MKILDIAIQDMVRSFRSAFAIVFMFGIPLMVTGMFYFMFGNIATSGEFNLPRTQVVVANLDAGGPKFQISTKNIPEGGSARTMGDLVVNILASKDLAKLIDVSRVSSAELARAAVDNQIAQVAVIIPTDFSKKFADPDAQAVIEFYQDPTLTIGPGIIRSIMNQFMDGMAGVKIAIKVFTDEAAPYQLMLVSQVVTQYLDATLVQEEDLTDALVESSTPNKPASDENDNPLLKIVSPIMAGMMVFYAFFTGASTAQSILKEEEERTLPRLFTTPTPQVVILAGKFLAVFLTVLVQVVTLIIVSHFIFGIQWGEPGAVALAAAGIIFIASTFGICLNSFMKSTKQGGTVFGGILTITGMVGMMPIFAMGASSAGSLMEIAALLVPQGWANRVVLQTMNAASIENILLTMTVMLVLSVAFFIIGVWRFNKRYV
ncbi:MAG: ABC transporter permease [Chloroflexi bacterium]|nr:ABC transporter permease [Chloroflexota bacterium]